MKKFVKTLVLFSFISILNIASIACSICLMDVHKLFHSMNILINLLSLAVIYSHLSMKFNMIKQEKND